MKWKEFFAADYLDTKNILIEFLLEALLEENRGVRKRCQEEAKKAYEKMKEKCCE